MPTGIILSSGSVGATQEAIEEVLTKNGYEADKEEAAPAEVTEPKRDDFKSDAEFEKAQDDFEAKQEEAAAVEEEQKEKERLAALPKKTRLQRKVEVATKELREQNRKLEERLAALESGGKKAAAVEEPKIAAPKREDFKSDDEFADAMFDYRYKLRRAKEDAETAQKAIENRLKQSFESYQASVAAFKEEHDDWDEVVNDRVRIPEAVYYAIVDLGKEGPAVTYYLGQNPDAVDKLAEMTPYRAAMEIGRLADKLNGKAKPDPKADAGERPRTRPRIPEPVKPVSTAATASTLTSKEAAQSRNYRAFKVAQARGV